MDKKDVKLDFYIDYANLNTEPNATSLKLRGWVHEKDFTIILKEDNHVLYSNHGNEARFDVCVAFDETVDNNLYGFNIELYYEREIKSIDIFVEADHHQIKIMTLKDKKDVSTKQKIHSMLSLVKKGLKSAIVDYHFLMPVSVIQNYWQEGINILRSENTDILYYNPAIKHEYQKWIMFHERKKRKRFKSLDISFIIFITDSEKDDSIVCRESILNQLKKAEIYECRNLNDYYAALDSIQTKYICIIDDKCILHANYAIEIYPCLNQNYQMIYYDHDCLDDDNERYCPYFKPDFSKDTLHGANYIGPCFVVEKSLIKKINIFHPYAVLLDIKDHLNHVYHLPKMMYHTKKYIMSQNDLLDINKWYFKERNCNVEFMKNEDNETITIKYLYEDAPLISIIIPTKDHADDLEICLNSIYTKSTYKNFEIIMIDNNSEEEMTFQLFKKYESKFNNFHVYRLECPFNYSYINNQGVAYSNGEYIVLLNNDTEVISSDWLENMLSYARQPHIGTVGAKLLFSDNTIQHAGIIMGKGGIAGHTHYKQPRDYVCRQWELKIPYNVTASTAACLMIEKKKFQEVHGLNEDLAVAFNDVDFNLKILGKGYSNIFLPYVELYHHESKSRGLDVAKEKQKRFNMEIQYMIRKWKDEIYHDQYYNQNFSLTYDYMLDPSQKVFK